jgi:hypothetical protein
MNILLTLIAAAAFVAVACGSQDQAAAPAAGPGTPQTALQQDASLKTSLVTRPEKTYALDELVAAGWKKSRAFETGTLPGATAAVLGFYNQKDIEVWVYPAHADALQQGVPVAEKAVASGADLWTGVAGSVNRYNAFAVAGNLVLLCELDIADCEALIARLP